MTSSRVLDARKTETIVKDYWFRITKSEVQASKNRRTENNGPFSDLAKFNIILFGKTFFTNFSSWNWILYCVNSDFLWMCCFDVFFFHSWAREMIFYTISRCCLKGVLRILSIMWLSQWKSTYRNLQGCHMTLEVGFSWPRGHLCGFILVSIFTLATELNIWKFYKHNWIIRSSLVPSEDNHKVQMGLYTCMRKKCDSSCIVPKSNWKNALLCILQWPQKLTLMASNVFLVLNYFKFQ